MVEALNAEGLEVIAYDHQSFGLSEGARPGEKGYFERFEELVDDAVGMARKLATEGDMLPLFALGVSMGGCVAVRAAQREPTLFSRASGTGGGGVALVAPMLSLERAATRGLNRLLLPIGSLASAVAPTLPVAEGSAENKAHPLLPTQQDADELCLPADAPTVARVANEYYTATQRAQEAMHVLIDTPLLTIHSPEDEATDPLGSHMLGERAGARVVTTNGGSHNLLTEPGKEAVHKQIADWMACRAMVPRTAPRCA